MIFSAPIMAIIIVAVIVIGFLIGAVSIGGVIIVPLLVLLTDIEIHVAVASVIFTAIFTGTLGAYMFARMGAVDWPSCLWLSIGAMAGAYLGSSVLIQLPSQVVEALVGVMVLGTGINAVLSGSEPKGARPRLSPVVTSITGFIAAFGSAVSGAGGPLLLVPMLMWMRVPVITAIALGQVFQVPVGLFATLRNWQSDIIDFQLGFLIAACLLIGVYFGARFSGTINASAVKRILAVVLIGVGVLLFARLLF
ncbi:MAG: sulfite exporter TauE/SafE family protein [Rhodospirillaceae bacterium]|jgi:hypothetical protein|nr:sulfite exporter TauE/SafE family protein [Rhodospirillaceae bacterium]MBT3883799.1 sulfite exporter TauE/SafE family protein [Rhodospirillaceae bacterium]MBT4115626.1 sulfite exporter TauE/SafE family protein [Rhodospirillaceae bacterium]MBT4671332.1 sulfite exporter TauE/SafE family protein [Rhodospirillaceae bacterium]MBT4721825.1 sulfite exporter TauE/SafE family protein [Rhodospirillaceae bacterium]